MNIEALKVHIFLSLQFSPGLIIGLLEVRKSFFDLVDFIEVLLVEFEFFVFLLNLVLARLLDNV